MNSLDETQARRLLSPLAGEPDGPQRLDLAAITRAGGRRRLNRRLAGGGLAMVAAVAGCGTFLLLKPGTEADIPAAGLQSPAAAGAAFAPVGARCPAAPLAGPTGRILAVDRTGHYTVETSGSSVAIWKDGQKTKTVALPAPEPVEVAVNATGELALTLREDQKAIPYAYVGGTPTRLKGGGYIADIADDGRIGGTSGNRPAVWASPDAEPTRLPLPPGTTHGAVIGFDTDGTILAIAQNSANTRTTVLLWPRNGTEAQTVTVPGKYAEGLSVYGIRDGKVIGDTARNMVFSYDTATRKFTRLPSQATGLQGIGGNGTVLGAPTDSVPVWAVVDGTAHELAPLNGITSYSIVGVANDGRTVVGNSWPGSGKAVPTTWNCGG
jgi:hypothetical protein